MDAAMESEKSKIELGARVKDKVTGYAGILTARTQHLHSDTQVLIESDGTGRRDKQWFAEARVVLNAIRPVQS